MSNGRFSEFGSEHHCVWSGYLQSDVNCRAIGCDPIGLEGPIDDFSRLYGSSAPHSRLVRACGSSCLLVSFLVQIREKFPPAAVFIT